MYTAQSPQVTMTDEQTTEYSTSPLTPSHIYR